MEESRPVRLPPCRGGGGGMAAAEPSPSPTPGIKALSATASAASPLTIQLSGAAAAPAVVRERREIRPPQHAAGREPAGAKRRARHHAGLSFLSRTPGSYGCDESACASPTMTFAP